MSNSLSEMDRELLGEIPHNNGAEAAMAKANGGAGHGASNASDGTGFTPLNATAGTLIMVGSNGGDLEAGKGKKDTNPENIKATPKTPKKRGAAAAANDESSQPAKKRSPVKKVTNVEGAAEPVTPSKKRAAPKKKNATNVDVKVEHGETGGETEGPEPVTPKKGKRAPAKVKAEKSDSDAKTGEATDKSVSPTKGNGEIEGTTVHNTPRKRQAPKKELAAPRGIPSSWDEADQADRMMVTMKERGETWTDIRTAWKAATGQDTAASTLPNRYNRIKVNMMRMKDGDDQHLLAAKKDVEDAYITNFWANVATNMERRGADKYPTAFLQKTFKDLEAAGKTTINPANATSNDAISTKTTTSSNDATSTKTTTSSNDATSTAATTSTTNTPTNGTSTTEANKDVAMQDGDAS